MTTTTLKQPAYTTTASSINRHYAWLGLTKLVCIQPQCDGIHHFYCSCRGR